MKGIVLIFTLVLGIAACTTEPDPEFMLNFSVAELDSAVVEGDTVIFTPENLDFEEFRNWRPITASVTSGSIRVLGSYVAPCANGIPEATMERQPDGVALIVSWPPPGHDVCATLIAPYTYEARFTQVPSGTYHLSVEHAGDALWGDGKVLEQQVIVP